MENEDRKPDLTGNPGEQVRKIVHTAPKENETTATNEIEPKEDQTMGIEESKGNQIMAL